jgi:hypothetical protein
VIVYNGRCYERSDGSNDAIMKSIPGPVLGKHALLYQARFAALKKRQPAFLDLQNLLKWGLPATV